MEVSSVINNERVSARIPYNVASILRYLTRSDATDVTASELCAELQHAKITNESHPSIHGGPRHDYP